MDVDSLVRSSWFQVAFVTVLLTALFASSPPADLDLFHRVAVGRLVEANGGVVHVDPFAFTEKHDRWIDHEWLSGVVFYQAVKAWGDAGLLVVTLLTLVATAGLASRAQKLHQGTGAGTFAWFLFTMVVTARAWGSVVRSQSFTFVALALQLLVLVQWRRGRAGWLWVLPVVYVPWANLHGGFVAGLGLLGSAAAAVTLERGRSSRGLWLCLAACVLVTLINPYGVAYWEYLAGALMMDRPNIVEWGPLPLGSFWGLLALGLLGIFVAGSFRAEPKPPPEAWAVVAASFLATVSSRRFLSIFVLTLVVWGTPSARALLASFRRRLIRSWGARPFSRAAGDRDGRLGGRPLARAAGAAGLVVGLAAVTQQAVVRVAGFARDGMDFERFPVEAVRWLESRGGGNLLVHFNVGSYALWRLYPRYRVSMDGRYEEVYPQETVDRVMTALDPTAEGHAEALRTVAPDFILLDGVEGGEAEDFGPDWHRVYADHRALVLSRSPTPPEPDPAAVPRSMWVPAF